MVISACLAVGLAAAHAGFGATRPNAGASDSLARHQRPRPTAPGLPSNPRVELRFDPRFTFDSVAREMGILLPPGAPMPAVRVASMVSVKDFQNAVAGQWSPAPQVVSNVYSVAQNAVYLDEHAHHPAFGRTLDDQLAHEFVHFFQARYLGIEAQREEDEEQAVMIQLWFRSRHAGATGAGP